MHKLDITPDELLTIKSALREVKERYLRSLPGTHQSQQPILRSLIAEIDDLLARLPRYSES